MVCTFRHRNCWVSWLFCKLYFKVVSDGVYSAGVGAQLGAEVTDFVMILNDASAVKTFAQSGSLTLGGNVSVAAGPVGRNAEASGAASLRSVSAIFSYSKTKGLFAGVSLEGSAIIERKDANAKFYGGPVTAAQLLSGTVAPPPEADALLSILNSAGFSPRNLNMYSTDDSVYNDYTGADERGASAAYGRPSRASTWASTEDNTYGRRQFQSTYSDNPDRGEKKAGPPGRPTAPKPVFRSQRSSTLGADQAVALYTFKPTQEGDLGFQKGDIITITKRTESKNVSFIFGT